MKRFITLAAMLAAALMVSAITMLPLPAQTGQETQQPNHPHAQKSSSAPAADRGQQVFDQNCSRCHNPPEGFSPRISGTVALHMRVRANLSDADYKALLHFLNP
jgi:cytochrome c5